MSKNNEDLVGGSMFLLVGFFLALSSAQELAVILFIGVALYFGISGFYLLFTESKADRTADSYLQRVNSYSRNGQPEHILPTTSAPITDEPTIAEKIKAIHIATGFKCPSCGATVNPTDTKCQSCGSFLVAAANLPKPNKWGDVEINQPVHVAHPKDGELILSVRRRIYYGELWQVHMKPDVPWTLTGSYYVGLALNKSLFLMNWQSRFYLLDSHFPLTDMDINRDFAPHARKFAASNQTAKVVFDYRGTKWHINDIGRFRVEFADGNETNVSAGAAGRFIHAGFDNRALVVEDYQSGGNGPDTLWMGYEITEKDIKF